MNVKKVIYRNSLGQEVVFDNKILFCESIDMTGNSGIHTTETLAFADGQVTTAHQLGAKTIPCSFALKDADRDIWLRDRLAAVFNPLVSGVLTVYDRENKYEIDVYPQNVPVFTKDKKVAFVWRWNVDFVADYPYWRVGVRHTIPLTHNSTKVIYNPCSVELPLEIDLKGRCTVAVSGGTERYFYIEPHPDGKSVTVNTKTYKITDESGNNVNYLIDANREIDKITLLPGENTVTFLSDNDGTMSYYHLSTGVF